MQKKIEKLLEIASDADKVELKIIHNAYLACLKALNENPTEAGTRTGHVTNARKGLEETVARLWASYFPETKGFENGLAAWKWLQAKNYKVGRAKFYKDLKDPKKLQQEADGSILQSKLELYAGTLKYLGDPAEAMQGWQTKEAKLKVEKLETETALKKIELQLKQAAVILRRDADLMRTAIITVLDSTLKNAYITRAPALVEVVAGDPAKVRALIAELNEIQNDAFCGLADMGEFEIDIT